MLSCNCYNSTGCSPREPAAWSALLPTHASQLSPNTGATCNTANASLQRPQALPHCRRVVHSQLLGCRPPDSDPDLAPPPPHIQTHQTPVCVTPCRGPTAVPTPSSGPATRVDAPPPLDPQVEPLTANNPLAGPLPIPQACYKGGPLRPATRGRATPCPPLPPDVDPDQFPRPDPPDPPCKPLTANNPFAGPLPIN